MTTAVAVGADPRTPTPRMTEGPFYPDQLPLDQDNDLVQINESTTLAVGEVTDLTGRILDSNGKPLAGTAIEIWQCDASGVYLHSRDSKPNQEIQDKHFQGFGRFETDASGNYRFRTIKPVSYRGRPAPHIHFKVLRHGRELLTSQIFVAGDPGNQKDGLFRGLKSKEKQELLSVAFQAKADASPVRYTAAFDIVLGKTPEDG